jgi:hypothetical protein
MFQTGQKFPLVFTYTHNEGEKIADNLKSK